MDQDTAQTIYTSLGSELAEAEERAKFFAHRGAAIRKVMDGLIELFPSMQAAPAKATSVDTRPSTGRDVLRMAMSGSGVWYAASEIADRVGTLGMEIGSDHPEHTIRRWLRDAFDQKMVDRRKRDGRTLEYRWLDTGEVQNLDGLFLDDEQEDSG